MAELFPLIVEINSLCAAGQQVREELSRLTVSGNALSDQVASHILRVNALLSTSGFPGLALFVGDNQVDDDLLDSPGQLLGQAWRCVLGKGQISAKLAAGFAGKTFMFFDPDRFVSWLQSIEPLIAPSHVDDPFNGDTLLRVYGLEKGVWGPQLKVLGLDEPLPGKGSSKLPDDQTVSSHVKVTSIGNLKLKPQSWEITDGDTLSSVAKVIRGKSARVLTACLGQQVVHDAGGITVTLRGGRRIDLLLDSTPDDYQVLPKLNEALEWVYAERTETRIKLLAEALSVELGGASSLMTGLRKYLAEALDQARDSYGFVILERKDAYYKELRDFMKDMKGQADQYASKVRDLVAALARDVVGVLVLVGFSFIGKFDVSNLQALITSPAFALLCKGLAGYLFFSSALLMLATYRDADLALNEVRAWFKIMQNYTSSDDFTEKVLGPLTKRRTFLFIMMAIIGGLYLGAILLVISLPSTVPAVMGWKAG